MYASSSSLMARGRCFKRRWQTEKWNLAFCGGGRHRKGLDQGIAIQPIIRLLAEHLPHGDAQVDAPYHLPQEGTHGEDGHIT